MASSAENRVRMRSVVAVARDAFRRRDYATAFRVAQCSRVSTPPKRQTTSCKISAFCGELKRFRVVKCATAARAGTSLGCGSIRRFALRHVASLLLDARHISKSFAGLRALDRVSFDLRAGEVHALVGENGAGKSTLIKIITGAEQADAGTLASTACRHAHRSAHLARAAASRRSTSSRRSFPHLTVAENIALSLERGGAWRRIDCRRAAAARRPSCSSASAPRSIRIGWSATLTMPEQQVVEIAKAIGADARIVIMDEPTASLSEREVTRLFAVIARLRGDGVGIIYISHRLEEIAAIADRITVLRDGQTVATRDARDVTRADLIRMMVGRELDAVFPKREVPLGETALDGARPVESRAPASATCRSRSGAARFSASPGSSARDARSWPRPSSA